MKRGTVAVYTLGCKVNQYESRALTELLQAQGVEPVDSGADACVVNTCAVTAESERKARQTVRRALRENPGAYLLVTGCAGQVSPEAFADIPGVDYVCGNREKTALAEKIVTYLDTKKKDSGVFVQDLTHCPYEKMEVSASERTRAYMKVEDGCESCCAYCIIPRARGPVVSRPVEECVREARRLTETGYREIVLTAIELSAYGKDLQNTDAADLVLALEDVPLLRRLRFSSIDPAFLRPEVTDRLCRSSKLTPHFHLSLQSGCDETLRRMRRGYNRRILTRNVSYLQEKMPGICFTADLIVGFPGETREELEQTKAFLQTLPLIHTHVFPFSPRPLTEAFGLPGQVGEEEKKSRCAELIAFCDGIAQKTMQTHIGEETEVLFETRKGRTLFGHTGHFIPVQVSGKKDLRGQIVPVRLTGTGPEAMTGELLFPEEAKKRKEL